VPLRVKRLVPSYLELDHKLCTIGKGKSQGHTLPFSQGLFWVYQHQVVTARLEAQASVGRNGHLLLRNHFR
jgi:hypothetical protein